jgi:hypothetical protein
LAAGQDCQGRAAQTKVIAIRLAKALDADTIQDLYQDEMDDDGYFEPVDTDE